jgi:hypothetical protein
VHGLIEEFKAGLLPLAEGTSLRTFLSKMLNCQPMRISKKFVGSNYNGKQVYVRRKNTLPNEEVRARRAKLQELERKFLAKASPMSAMSSNDNIMNGSAASSRPTSHSDLEMTAAGLLGGGGMPQGMDAALLAAGRSGSNSKAAAAGRALLLGGSGLSKPSGGDGGGGPGGLNLAGFSTSELAAELEKRAKSEMQSRSSVENFLGSASELQARASVETLLQNPFGHSGSRGNLFSASGSRGNLLSAAASGSSSSNLLNAASSFHRGPSATNLLNAALQKNSTSNLLNAARGSFHNNSTTNLLNAARNSTRNLLGGSAFSGSRSSLLNANFAKKNSTSNLLNAMASRGALRKESASNLLSAARGGGDSSRLQQFLAAREATGNSRDAISSAASLSDLLERHNSMDFRDRVSGLMEVQASKNWSAGATRPSRSDLSNLRLSMQNDDEVGASSIFGNASFGGRGSNRKKSLAELLKERGMGAAAALAAAGADSNKESSLTADMLEKEALMRQLQSAGGFDSGHSPIGEYLLKQQLAGAGDDGGSASAGDADEAELRHMLELKRKFLSQDAAAGFEELAAKRLRGELP